MHLRYLTISTPKSLRFISSVTVPLEMAYSDFPIFKDVKQEDFREVFMSYKQIMNMSMTKLAYYNGKAVGFYVSIPDYGNLVYHTGNPLNIMKLIQIKSRREYNSNFPISA